MTNPNEVKPCPFCSSSNISNGEILASEPDGTLYTQSECQNCGAVGPKGMLDYGEVDYGDVKAITAWNTRSATSDAANLNTDRGLYLDLLHQLGVNGHSGATAEIAKLRSFAGLEAVTSDAAQGQDAKEGDYNALEIGFGWVAYQAATLKERERCAGICKAQAEAAKKAGNTQYQIGCLECLDEIGSGK